MPQELKFPFHIFLWKKVYSRLSKNSSITKSNIIKSELQKWRSTKSLHWNGKFNKAYPYIIFLNNDFAYNINGKSLITFHISHAFSFSLECDPDIILIVCGLLALSGLQYLNSDINIRADFLGKFSTCLWRQATWKILKFTFWNDLDI